MKLLGTISLAALITLTVSPQALRADCGGCTEGKAKPAPMAAAKKDIVDTAVAAGSFKTLVAAVKQADLVATLKSDGPFTVFAPADAAFAKLPNGTVEGLLKDKAALTSVLTYHVVPGRLTAADVIRSRFLNTAQGQALRVQTGGEGEVHIAGARVVTPDIETSNGIIHVIDSVMLPKKDIVDTAVEAGSFKTLVTAVKAANLVQTLKSKGPFTVFAPTDAAFAKLPAGTVEALVKDTPKLTSILTYHVIPSRVLSSDIEVGTASVKTVQGQTITVKKTEDGKVFVDGAQVIKADIETGNGFIHVIDSVVLPK